MLRFVVPVAVLAVSITAGASRVAPRSAGGNSDRPLAGFPATRDTSPGMPPGWLPPDARAGAVPADYEVGVDRGVKHAGMASGYIRSTAPDPRAFMTLVQGVRADAYRGRRIRFSGYVRAQDVASFAGLWMQVVGPNGPAGFDNMQNRPIHGTSDWARYSVVLDVPADAGFLVFGFLLAGRGRAWVDDLRFDVVGPDVPSTNIQTPAMAAAVVRDSAENARFAQSLAKLPAQPANLDFEAPAR